MKLSISIATMMVTLASTISFAVDQVIAQDFPANSPRSASPLDGAYKLDFNASPGTCEETIFLKYQDGKSDPYEKTETFEVRFQPNEYPDEYNIGAFCSDRRFPGDPVKPIESCADWVETNRISSDKRFFKHRKDYYRRDSSGGIVTEPILSQTYKLIAKDRLEVFGRCRYDRVK